MAERMIVRTAFDPNLMLEMTPEDARKYLMLNYFVPLAHLMNENMRGTQFATMHIVIDSNGTNRCPISLSNIYDNNLEYVSSEEVIFAENNVNEHKAFGESISATDLSKALAHAFPGYPIKGNVRHWSYIPLVATIGFVGTAGARYTLNVLTKSWSRYNRGYLSQAPTRAQAFAMHDTYPRVFNTLTGEWVGKCEDTDCATCKAIDDAGLTSGAFGGEENA